MKLGKTERGIHTGYDSEEDWHKEGKTDPKSKFHQKHGSVHLHFADQCYLASPVFTAGPM